MNSDKYAPRLAGLMFVIVIVIGVLSGSVLTPLNYKMTGPPENISETMINFSDNPTMVQISIIGYLIEAAAIVLLTVSLYTTLKNQNRVIARWAFGLWIMEAVAIAVREINAFSLLYTGQEFVRAGAPDSSYFQILGSLFYRLMHFSYDAQMVFYCIGGILFYCLFLKSRYIPRVFPVWGLIVASLGFIGEVLALFGYHVPLYVFLPILPFELAIGIWLMAKGIRDGSETK